jgi:hypothetical protein
MRHLPSLLLVLLVLVSAPARAGSTFSASDERLGKLGVGLAASQVKAALGAPASKGSWIDEPATGLAIQEWDYPALGITVTMSREEPGGAVTVSRFFVEAPCRLATSRGIRIGDPGDKVRRAYKGLLNREDSGPESLVVGSVYDGVVFTLKAGKVTRIFVGAAAE